MLRCKEREADEGAGREEGVVVVVELLVASVGEGAATGVQGEAHDCARACAVCVHSVEADEHDEGSPCVASEESLYGHAPAAKQDYGLPGDPQLYVRQASTEQPAQETGAS